MGLLEVGNEEDINALRKLVESVVVDTNRILKKHEEAITILKEKGWKGPSNSNYIKNSEQYTENLNSFKNNIDSFHIAFNQAVVRALNSLKN